MLSDKENNLELSELQKEKIKEFEKENIKPDVIVAGLQIAYVFIYGTINKNLILNILRMYY